MRKNKSQWLKEIESSLERVKIVGEPGPEFKLNLINQLSIGSSSIAKVPMFTALAIAASFTALLLANIWLYNSQQSSPNQLSTDDFAQIIDEYNVFPPSFGKTYNL